MTAQEFNDRYNQLKDQSREINEQINLLTETFLKEHEVDLEYPIQVDGTPKFVRVFRPEGQFVYNRLFEVGVRKTAQNPVP